MKVVWRVPVQNHGKGGSNRLQGGKNTNRILNFKLSQVNC